jgi:hypothetical protein
MRDEDIIGFHRRLPPFRAKRVDWRNHPLLVKRRNIPPPELTTLPPVTDLKLTDTTPLTEDRIIVPDDIR